MSEAHLERKLGVVSATALVVSNMIGVGIFATTGFLAGDLGSPQLVVGIWLVGAAIALLGALCYSELGINFPRSGGEYVYLSEAWGPTWGFIDGWVSFFAGFSAPIAATALVISAYLAHFYPSLESGHPGATVIELGFVTIQLGGAQLAACGIVIAFTLLNLLGVSQVAALQNVLTATKLLVIAAFVVLGFTVGTGDWGHFTQSIEPTSSHGLGVQFAISLVFVYLGYSGWNAAVYVAEEIRNPGRTLPIALILGTFLVAILYVVLNCLYVFAVPLEDLKGVVAVGSAASASLFGPRVSGLFSAAMAVSLLATVNAMCMIGPRVYYAMAKNRAFFAIAARVHPRWKSPWLAVICQGICCCLLILTATFRDLLVYVGFTLNLFSALSVLALLKFRGRPEWKRLPWVSFGYPLLPSLYIAVNLWIFLHFATSEVKVAAWSLATIVAGALIYHFSIKRGHPEAH